MAEISDTELLHALMENDANKAPGLKAVAAWDPATQMPYSVYHCEPSHTVDEADDTKICCPGCGQLCDMDCCWCGDTREAHMMGAHQEHSFVPMGCDCSRDGFVPTLTCCWCAGRSLPGEDHDLWYMRHTMGRCTNKPPKPPEPEVEHEWDIL